MERVLDLVRSHVHAGIFLVTLIDATGIPFPGRAVLIMIGVFVASADVHLAGVILAAALGALGGDHIWYLGGRLRGERMLAFFCRALPGMDDCAERARGYVTRYGALSFVVGRFVGGVRMLVAPVASAYGIGYVRFLAFDFAGSVLWAATFILLGYVAGAQAPALVERYGIAGQLVLGALVTGVGLVAMWLVRRFSRSPRDVLRRARGRRPRRVA